MRSPNSQLLLLAAIFTGAVPTPEAHAQPSGQPDLSPTAAAYTIEAPPIAPSPTRSAKPSTESPRESVTQPEIEDPELPGLVRKADGSYRFQGTNFSAVIAKDGQVTFRDSYIGFSRRMAPLPPPPVDRDPTPSGANYQRSTPWLALQLRIDLHGYIESRLGNDPYQSERRWFMDRTRDLRESLGERSLNLGLRSMLLRIWSDAELSLAARKRETFEVWNHTSDGEDGRAARRTVQEFIRERCPLRSSCEFRAADLKRFNDVRLQKEVFSPYTVAPTEQGKRSAPGPNAVEVRPSAAARVRATKPRAQ